MAKEKGKFLTVTEAAESLGVTRKTILRWIDEGNLRASRVRAGISRQWFIDREDFSKVLVSNIPAKNEAESVGVVDEEKDNIPG